MNSTSETTILLTNDIFFKRDSGNVLIMLINAILLSKGDYGNSPLLSVESFDVLQRTAKLSAIDWER